MVEEIVVVVTLFSLLEVKVKLVPGSVVFILGSWPCIEKTTLDCMSVSVFQRESRLGFRIRV